MNAPATDPAVLHIMQLSASAPCHSSSGAAKGSNYRIQPHWGQDTGMDASVRPSQRETLLLVRRPQAQVGVTSLGLVQQRVLPWQLHLQVFLIHVCMPSVLPSCSRVDSAAQW